MKHKCPVPECQRQIDKWHFMCFEHWRAVSNSVQANLYRTFRAWKNGDLSAQPYHDAMDAAIKQAQAVAR